MWDDEQPRHLEQLAVCPYTPWNRDAPHVRRAQPRLVSKVHPATLCNAVRRANRNTLLVNMAVVKEAVEESGLAMSWEQDYANPWASLSLPQMAPRAAACVAILLSSCCTQQCWKCSTRVVI